MYKYIVSILLGLSLMWGTNIAVSEARVPTISITSTPTASPSAEATVAAEAITPPMQSTTRQALTQPETDLQREEVLQLLAQRPISSVRPWNFLGFLVRYVISTGVPATTLILILLIPVIATGIVFFRHIVGLPTLGLIVPLALAITLLSTEIVTGTILLATILFSSLLSRFLLKKIHLMQMPKMTLSILVVGIFVILVLMLGAMSNLFPVQQISIFPILMLIILSERITALQATSTLKETLYIALINLGLGIGGYLVLSWPSLRNYMLLYPELVLLVIPINIYMGRYFGLRLTEVFRFRKLKFKNGHK